jgi:hypothetical protein
MGVAEPAAGDRRGDERGAEATAGLALDDAVAPSDPRAGTDAGTRIVDAMTTSPKTMTTPRNHPILCPPSTYHVAPQGFF